MAGLVQAIQAALLRINFEVGDGGAA